MAQQAQPNLPVGDDLQAAFGVARRSGERSRDRVADDRVGPQRLLRRRTGPPSKQAEPDRKPLQPNTSP
jgi:hypothetical protein